MKKIPQICLILLLQFCPAVAFSQIGSAETQVNVVIGQVLSIEVSQPSVNIQMGVPSHFINGNSSAPQANHVQVTSNTGYEVNVKAATQYFSLAGNVTTLPVSTINILTAVGDDLTGQGATPPAGLQVMPEVQLSSTDNTVINSIQGESARGFNVTYSIPANQADNYLNRDTGTYSTTIIYTITPQ